jgi:putative membrane protein
MRYLALLLTVVVIALHFAFMVLEMFYWTEPAGMRVFGTTPEFAKASAVLAANQGLYNGLFAAAMAWALLARDRSALMVLLACMVVAGLYGAATAKPTILLVQALPAFLALLTTWLAGRSSLR